MRCIACNAPLVVLELREVEVDYCLECTGIWLDEGELEQLFGDPARAARFVKCAAGAGKRAAGRRCPICRRRMEAVRTGGGEGEGPAGVEIDRCVKGHGLWFDRGELETVLKAFGREDEQGRVGSLLRDLFGTMGSEGKES